MNLGDKTRSVTVRLSPEQYEFLERSALAIEVTPSKFLRMVVNSCMIGSAVAELSVNSAKEQLEHAKTDLDNLLEQ